MNLITLLLLALFAMCSVADDVLDDDCQPANGITPICGFLPPEDIDAIPGRNALVVGGFSLDNQNGEVRVLDLSDHSITTIYTPDMPMAIQITENAHGSYTLLVVNHTSREAIEWIEVKQDGARFSGAWKGCVIVDPGLWINDIAMLPDGGFVASHMMPRKISRSIFDREPNDRVETGYVVEWHKETGWTKIKGTEGALPNGVQVSADGATVYSNHYFANQIVAIDRASGERLWTTPLDGAPDNINIGDDGKLYLPTHLVNLREIRDQCLGKDVPYCTAQFSVYAIEPDDGQATRLFTSSGTQFGASTAAIKVGEFVYLGAVGGNRIGRIGAP